MRQSRVEIGSLGEVVRNHLRSKFNEIQKTSETITVAALVMVLTVVVAVTVTVLGMVGGGRHNPQIK